MAGHDAISHDTGPYGHRADEYADRYANRMNDPPTGPEAPAYAEPEPPALTAERALLLTVVLAARERCRAEHNDTCGVLLCPGAGYPCDCGHDPLAAALAALLAAYPAVLASPPDGEGGR